MIIGLSTLALATTRGTRDERTLNWHQPPTKHLVEVTYKFLNLGTMLICLFRTIWCIFWTIQCIFRTIRCIFWTIRFIFRTIYLTRCSDPSLSSLLSTWSRKARIVESQEWRRPGACLGVSEEIRTTRPGKAVQSPLPNTQFGWAKEHRSALSTVEVFKSCFHHTGPTGPTQWPTWPTSSSTAELYRVLYNWFHWPGNQLEIGHPGLPGLPMNECTPMHHLNQARQLPAGRLFCFVLFRQK